MRTKLVLVLVMLFASVVRAEDPATQAQAAIDKGLEFLKSKQRPDHTWQAENEPPAMTAIVLKSFLGDKKYNASTPFVKDAFDALLKHQKENGGIYKDMQANYNTAIAISALAMAPDAYKPQMDRAVTFLRKLQWSDEPAEGVAERKPVTDKEAAYGGFGYGRKERPDLSNLQVALDALKDSGLKPSDPAFQRALKFVARTQNLSETNDQPWASNDGGFVYTPALNGESFAGEYIGADGRRMLRSYGSMTYAGLKSLIYAGLTKDDQRVKAAWDWINKNWTLDENPGMKLGDASMSTNGLYYYYHTLARCLSAYGEPSVTDANGKKHDWRVELIQKLSATQKPDGSWAGEKRWMEDNPILVTSYCVTALQEAKQDLAEHPAK